MTENEINQLNEIKKMIESHSTGVTNVYQEIEKVRNKLDIMKSLQDRMNDETLPIDESEVTIRIKSYPMNIRVFMQIETNFGEISSAFDFPPFKEDKLSETLHSCYFNLLNELYDVHEERGGHFPGDGSGNYKEWMDKNGRTIIKKEPNFSPRFPKEHINNES